MKIKKSTVRWWIVLAAGLVAYNVIVFAVPFVKTTVFFLSWGFTLLAAGAQAYVVHAAFGQGGDARSKFYGCPIARVGAAYLAAQLVLGLLFMALGKTVAFWIPLVLYVVLLAAAVIGFVAMDAVRDEVVRQDAVLAKNVSRMRELQAKASVIPGLAQEEALRKELERFSEDLRFSDPVSSEPLAELETELSLYLDQLQQAVVDGETDSALQLCKKAGAVLAERNRLCKLNKGAAR